MVNRKAILGSEPVLQVSEFVALVNQTFEFAFPSVLVFGELANFRVSKGKWIYFDLKDEHALVKCFGSVYQVPGPLENGMTIRVRGTPKLHPLFGFSITVQTIQPEGEGAIRRAADILRATLTSEGLFDEYRKRTLPFPPERIGLVTSTESAAYADFIKIINSRWRGVTIECIDVQVQGEAAPEQIISAITYFNSSASPPDVVVITRGGGSPEDLYAFNTEQVTRAVAASRVPTLVAIGHEIDTSLAELAADQRASTPSNAAEILVPDSKEIRRYIHTMVEGLYDKVQITFKSEYRFLQDMAQTLDRLLDESLRRALEQVRSVRVLMEVLNPTNILERGYAIVRNTDGIAIHTVEEAIRSQQVYILLSDGDVEARIQGRSKLDIKQ